MEHSYDVQHLGAWMQSVKGQWQDQQVTSG